MRYEAIRSHLLARAALLREATKPTNRHDYPTQHAAQYVASTLHAWGYLATSDGQFIVTNAPSQMVRKAEVYNYIGV